MDPSRDTIETADTTPLEAVQPEPVRTPSTMGFVIFVLVLITAFSSQLVELVRSALQYDLNSYIILIPFVSAYLLYVDRERLARVYERALSLAALPFLVAIACLILTKIGPAAASLSTNDRLALITLSFVCLIWTGGLLFMGKRWMISAVFPMLFLVFFVPLPDRVVDLMETGLRWASADAANMFFVITGTPAMKTGNIFQLPGITIEVAQECSGIRSSLVLFITSLVAAHLFLTKTSSRLLLIAAVIPLGILRNGF
ncbi:MAG TPA: exosortase/archaeosortase family protein, partial [Chthoniobacterales bacterium]